MSDGDTFNLLTYLSSSGKKLRLIFVSVGPGYSNYGNYNGYRTDTSRSIHIHIYSATT